MKGNARVFGFLLTGTLLFGGALHAKNQCIICHATLGEKHQAVLVSFENDIHRQTGLSCHSCHGGNPNAEDAGDAMNPAAGFVGTPSRKEIPAFCSKCHANPGFMKKYNPSLPVDQELKYYTSVHGKRLKAGDKNVATCVDCHTTHSIKPAKDPLSSVYSKNVPFTCGRCHSDEKRMARYKIPTNQVDEYKDSVHGKALLEKGDTAAPVCNTCHGNHGAVPPGVENIGHVCGMCHSQNEEFFKTSPMAKTWETRKYHVCAVCHGQHGIQHPTTEILSENGVCKTCHLPSTTAFKVGLEIKDELDKLGATFQDANTAITSAEEKGMDMAEAKDLQDTARMSLYQARTVVHTFRLERVSEIVNKGLLASQKARQTAFDVVKEFQWRRIGLGILTLFITFLCVALYLKIRDIETRK